MLRIDAQFTEDISARPSGEADVEFSCHEDAVRAMSKVGFYASEEFCY